MNGTSCWVRAYIHMGPNHDSGANFLFYPASTVRYRIGGTTIKPSFSGGQTGWSHLIALRVDGARWIDGDRRARYVLLDGLMRHIPSQTAHENLFSEWVDEYWGNVDARFGNTMPPAGKPLGTTPSATNPYGLAYLAKCPALPNVYIVVDGTKRWITSGEVFARFGFNHSKVWPVANELIAALPNGPDIR